MKLGDTVRFLNATGGGKITRIDEKKGLVYVEDEDGFEVPVLDREVIVIENVSEKNNVPKRNFSSKPPAPETKADAAPTVRATAAPEPVTETPGGDEPTVLLAFFPMDVKHLQTSSYECYLVNDSNYFLYYNIVNGDGDARKSVAHGEIEPNMQEFLTEVPKDKLNDWEHLQVQLLAFKKDKIYRQQPATDLHVRLDAVKFYKLSSFTENDYFNDPAMLINLSLERENQLLMTISPDEIKEAIFRKEQPERKPERAVLPRKKDNGIIEIDLHINNLLDSTAGMNNADMLRYQIDKFHAVLEENKHKRTQKIVFIHGKGEGVLRKEIEKQLKTKYRHYYFQDASFREYGFGATMVTIRQPHNTNNRI